MYVCVCVWIDGEIRRHDEEKKKRNSREDFPLMKRKEETALGRISD